MQVNSTSAKSALALAVLGLSVSLFAAPAAAVTKLRSSYQNAGGNCVSPDFLAEWGLVRYPNRVANEDNSAHTVVCSFPSDAFAVGSPSSVYVVDSVYLYVRRTINRADNASMTCTLTTGYYGSPSSVQITKTVSLPSSGAQAVISWTTGDNGGSRFAAPPNVQCNMPRNTELNDSLIIYHEDVGL